MGITFKYLFYIMYLMFYDKEVNDVVEEVKSALKGLRSEEAKKRLLQGKNTIIHARKISKLKILFSQFSSPLVWILLTAMIVSFVFKELVDFYVILGIVIVNALLGFFQEYKAEKAIDHLKKLLSLHATVIRDGHEQKINAEDLVVGDIILIETGDKVPADCRIIENIHLQTQEASLTGESQPISKQVKKIIGKKTIGDRTNMLFASTIVTNGRGKAVVVRTGMQTEIGKVAHLLQETKTVLTPLQKKLGKLGKILAVLVVIVAVVVFGVGVFTGKPRFEMFLAAIALAVAAIPEGLPAVVTVSLALGVQRMAKKHALVRKLPSVETLGACTVICADKTGTLTHNQMTVKKLYVNHKVISVPGSGYDASHGFGQDTRSFNLLLEIGALNNNAKLSKDLNVIGDPTEAALLVSAKKAGLDINTLSTQKKRIDELLFTSERKRMTTLHKIANKKVAYMKGAPDVVLKYCDKININGNIRKLTEKEKKKVLGMNKKFADDALRVLGFAYKEVTGKSVESNMVFVGLQAMIDPPRKEVKTAIATCKKAHIKVIMITGDHLATAQAIAKELGITGKAITGEELEHLKKFNVEDYAIYARVNPEHKLKIVRALQEKKHVVAMTGDGVNDAPALKKADLGVAMGITGTDVAKEASDMVLTDDNFTSIVNAVGEGRRIYANITKFVEYLLSSNLGEVLTVFIALLLGWPLPILAIHILWINLVTDGTPALALSVEPAEQGVMQKDPSMFEQGIVTRSRGIMMLVIGLLMTIGTLGLFYAYKSDVVHAQTIAFTTLVLFQMFNVINMRSEDTSIFRLKTNWWLLGAVLLSVSLQVMVVYMPFFNNIFSTVPLSLIDWGYALAASSSVLVFGEIVKLVKLAKIQK
jgi:P-type Ca2+ transporter type 2C